MFEPCAPHNHDVRTMAAAAPSSNASCSPPSFDAP